MNKYKLCVSCEVSFRFLCHFYGFNPSLGIPINIHVFYIRVKHSVQSNYSPESQWINFSCRYVTNSLKWSSGRYICVSCVRFGGQNFSYGVSSAVANVEIVEGKKYMRYLINLYKISFIISKIFVKFYTCDWIPKLYLSSV